MNAEINAVVFDMDGLMFNTEDLYDQVGDIILGKRGQKFTNELKLEMMGLPGHAAFEVLRSHCGLSDSVESLQQETDEIFLELLPKEIAKMPGLDSLLELIESKAIPKAVATSSHRKFATQALGFFDLEPRFDFVLTGDDVQRGKPDPDIYLLAAKKFDISASTMLVLEDSINGSRAATAAGAITVAVPTIHTSECDFSHVDYVASNLMDNFIVELIHQAH